MVPSEAARQATRQGAAPGRDERDGALADPLLGVEPALVLDLIRLTEPEYIDECWFTIAACAAFR